MIKSTTLDTAFLLAVNYKETIDAMASSEEIVSRRLLTAIKLPHEHVGTIVLYECRFLDGGVTTDEAFQKARKLESKLARPEHACAFSKKYPEEQGKQSILILGSTKKIDHGEIEKAAVLDTARRKTEYGMALNESALQQRELQYTFKEAEREWSVFMRILIAKKIRIISDEEYRLYLQDQLEG